jgi:hypothetical protein
MTGFPPFIFHPVHVGTCGYSLLCTWNTRILTLMHMEHAATHSYAHGTRGYSLFCTWNTMLLALLHAGRAGTYFSARGICGYLLSILDVEQAATHPSSRGTTAYSLIYTWDARRLTFLSVGHARFPTPDYVETCLPHALTSVQVISYLLSTRTHGFCIPEHVLTWLMSIWAPDFSYS